MNPYKLTFKLKQHTPIIHFQHDQHGATLRASELKPKLDKYILMKLGKEADRSLQENEATYNRGYEVAKEKKWFVGNGEHPALDYKVMIKISAEVSHYLPMPFISEKRIKFLKEFCKKEINNDVNIIAPSPFFANADKIKFNKDNTVDEKSTDIKELKFALFCENDIDGFVLAYKPGLINKVKQSLSDFFLINNFGTRQNKGFGSFSIKKLNIEEVFPDENNMKTSFLYKSQNSFSDFNGLFKFIVDEYQLLKSGKSFPIYEKSELFKYFIDKNIRWEKRWIKQKINTNRILNKELFWNKKSTPIDIDDKNNREYNEWADKQANDYKYIRALLGLAEQYEYTVFAKTKDDNGNWIKATNKKGNYFADSKKKYIVTSKHQPTGKVDKIERFKSPLFFKIIEGNIYLKIDHSYEEILDEEFEFNAKLKGDTLGTIKTFGKLKIPSSFDILNFIDKYISSNWKKL